MLKKHPNSEKGLGLAHVLSCKEKSTQLSIGKKMESVPKELRNLRACLLCSLVKVRYFDIIWDSSQLNISLKNMFPEVELFIQEKRKKTHQLSTVERRHLYF